MDDPSGPTGRSRTGPGPNATGTEPGTPGGGGTERRDNPGWGFVAAFALATVGAGMANIVPVALTVPLKAREISAAHAPEILSVVAAIGAVAAIVSFPLLGRVSDLTTGRLGRRRPFLLLGAALFTLGGLGYVLAPNTGLLVAAGLVSAVAYSAIVVSLTAFVADLFTPGRRGTVSAVLGLCTPLGAVVGFALARLVAPNLAAMVMVPAGVGAVGAVTLAAVAREPTPPPVGRARFDLPAILRSYQVDVRRHPAFGWVWTSRALLFLAVASVQAYQTFFLVDRLRVPESEVADALLHTTLVLTGCAVLFAWVAARASDRLGRRAPFVAGSSAVFAIGLVLAASAASLSAFLVAMAVIGLAQGVYLAVDISLITEVLPDPANPAKDVGIMNLASTLPTVVVPALAPLVLSVGASETQPRNYAALFLSGAVAALLGAACLFRIGPVGGTADRGSASANDEEY